MSAPGDQDAMFKRMFGSFIARRNRGSSSHHPPPRVEPPPRSSSSRSKSRGVSALFSSSGAHSPAHRSFQSSSSHRNNSSAAAAAAAAAAASFPNVSYAQPQYRHPTTPYNPPSRHDQERMSFGPAHGSGGRSGRGPLPFLLPGTPGAGRSYRQSGKPSDNSSTDGRPQKRIRTGEQSSAGTIARSHSAKSLGRSSSTRKIPTVEQSSGRAFARSQSAKTLSGNPALLPCEECDAKFKQQGQLNRHFKRVHLGIRHHKCEVCKKMFASRSDRDRHEEKLHKKPRFFPCSLCNFESLTKKHLREHLLAVHPENHLVVLPRKRTVHREVR